VNSRTRNFLIQKERPKGTNRKGIARKSERGPASPTGQPKYVGGKWKGIERQAEKGSSCPSASRVIIELKDSANRKNKSHG